MAWSKSQVSMRSRTQELASIPLDYVGKHKAMSSKTMIVDLLWQEKRPFAFTVNEHVFNPIVSIAAHKLVELILSEKIKVAEKSVIDLGCGSGVVGLCAITKGARKVLFTDINPHIQGIQQHPLFRGIDEVRVQSLLTNVPDASYDRVLVIPPAMVVEEVQPIAPDTFESGIFRHSDFYSQILVDSGRVLKPEGQLVIWLRIPMASVQSFIKLLALAAERFDLKSANLLADGVESVICTENEKSMLGRWMYKLQKGSVIKDNIWMFLSFTRL